MRVEGFDGLAVAGRYENHDRQMDVAHELHNFEPVVLRRRVIC